MGHSGQIHCIPVRQPDATIEGDAAINSALMTHKPGDHELSIAPVIARKLGEHPEKHQLNDQWRSK
jgi:hypothetical protein